MFLFLFRSVLEAFGIGLVGPFLALANNPNIVYQNSWSKAICEILSIKSAVHFIALLGFVIVVIFFIKSFMTWHIKHFIFEFSSRVRTDLSNKLMRAYLAAPYSFHLNKDSAHIIESINSYTKNYSDQILMPLLTSVANSMLIIALVILLCSQNLVAIFSLAMIIFPLIIIFKKFKNKIRYWGKNLSVSNEEMIRIVNHGLGGIRETKVIGCAPYFENQLYQQGRKYEKAFNNFLAFQVLPNLITEIVLVIFLVGFTSIYLLVNPNIEAITSFLGVFLLASFRLSAIPGVANSITKLRSQSHVIDRLYYELKEMNISNEVQVSDEANDSNLNQSDRSLAFKERITLDDLTYCYPGASENAINNVSLTLKKGQSIALIGRSGAGKTTLVDVILGLLIPQKGDIQVDGISIYNDLRAWQNLIGYIPQTIFLINDTIERNIAFGVPDSLINQQRLEKAIQAAQLSELIEQLPDGIKTKVGERGVRLSGGQRQRIGIARTLYHEREILVLDEATSALDNETESLVTEAIKSLSGTKTMILIAHRLTTVEHCDRIYLMEKGRIVKSGTYEEVILGEHLASQA